MGDLRLAVRALRSTPIVSTVAALSLALGIGANTAIFSLVNSLLLRTLPVVEPQRLVTISSDRAIGRGFIPGWSYPIWEQIQRRAEPFDGSFSWSTERFNLAQAGGESQPVDGLYASGDYFRTLGVPALLGRTFTSADDVRGGGKDGPVAVISYGLWQRRFGGAASVIGTPIVVERVAFTIVGVTPPVFFGTNVGRTFDLALPLGTEPLIRAKDSRLDAGGFYFLTVMLRLKPGQSLDAANAILRGVQPQIREAAMPATLPPQVQKEFLKETLTVVPAATGVSGLRIRYERPLVLLSVVVALVLLIACANIANLLLARATARRHELSVRLALGASRWRLARQLLVESLLLSGIGAGFGLVFASWGSRALVALLSTSINRVFLDLSLDWRVMAFTTAVAIATAILFGTAPAFRAARVAPIDALKEQGRGTSSDARVNLSNGLVVAQVALSLVLVVAAGLFVRTFERLAKQPLGFDSDRLLVVNVSVARAKLDAANRIAFFHRLAGEAAAVPGVARSAASMMTPVQGGGIVDIVSVPGTPPSFEPFTSASKLAEHSVFLNFITPGWFATYGTPMRAGRDFDERDTKTSPQVIVVNETFVRKFLAGVNPIGATVAFEHGRGAPVPKTVVGVVADAVYGSLRDDLPPTEYAPLAQFEFGGRVPTDVSLSLRSAAGSPMRLARGVAAALAAVDRDLVFTFRSIDDQVSASLTQERLIAMLSGFFGALALLLAGLGLYGVTSYAVTRRRTELGIRMALGAAPGAVVKLVLSRVSLLVGAGVSVGAVASVWLSRFIATLLFGVEPRDPAMVAAAAAVLAAVGSLAGWGPARRASRIDPADVLRES